ncbi:MAG TPA: thioredoxin domain-containing protein [Kofleriaceae bacterium]|nr:thioredoxin domain-containing protein [Kofleriaceae bacterium]
MRLCALIFLVTFASCYKQARDPALDKRLAAIEQRLDAQDKALADMRSRADSTELSLLAQQLADLSAKVDALADKVAKGPAPAAKRRRPDPALTYSVPLGASPVFGSPKAKVTLVMAFEFACQFCRRAWDTVDQLQKKYGKELRVAYKQYIVHPTKATAPAFAACAANHQKKWRPLAELMWAKAFDTGNFDPANVDAIATEAGLDMKQYQADTAGACVQEIKDEQDLMKKLAVGATPTFFINGRFMEGALPIEMFSKLIDEEMAKATAAQKKGAKPERYYDDEIVGKGVTEVPPLP